MSLAEPEIRQRERRVRRERLQLDDPLEVVDGFIGQRERVEVTRDTQPRTHLGQVGGVHTIRRAPAASEDAPAVEAGHDVMLVDVLNLGDLGQEERIAGMPLSQIAQKLERAFGLVSRTRDR